MRTSKLFVERNFKFFVTYGESAFRRKKGEVVEPVRHFAVKRGDKFFATCKFFATFLCIASKL